MGSLPPPFLGEDCGPNCRQPKQRQKKRWQGMGENLTFFFSHYTRKENEKQRLESSMRLSNFLMGGNDTAFPSPSPKVWERETRAFTQP